MQTPGAAQSASTTHDRVAAFEHTWPWHGPTTVGEKFAPPVEALMAQTGGLLGHRTLQEPFVGTGQVPVPDPVQHAKGWLLAVHPSWMASQLPVPAPVQQGNGWLFAVQPSWIASQLPVPKPVQQAEGTPGAVQFRLSQLPEPAPVQQA